MKKVFFLAVIIGSYVVLAWYSGTVGERNFNTHIDLARQELADKGVNLALAEYQRGVFSSRVRLRLDIERLGGFDNLPFAGVQTRLRITHGPLLFGHGPKFGAFGARGAVHMLGQDTELELGLTEWFGGEPIWVSFIGHYDSTLTAQVKVPPVGVREAENGFRLDGIELRVRADQLDRTLRGSYALGELRWRSSAGTAGGADFRISPVLGDFDMQALASGINLGSFTATIDEIGYAAMMFRATLHDIAIKGSRELVGERLDDAYEFTAERFQGPIDMTDLRHYGELSGVSPRALKLMQEWSRKAQRMTDPQDFDTQFEPALLAMLEALFKEGLELKTGVSAKLMRGQASADLSLEYVGQPATPSTIEETAAYIDGLDGEFLLRLSETVVNETPLIFMVMNYIGTVFHWQDEELILHATLREGVLHVGEYSIAVQEWIRGVLPGTSVAPGEDGAGWPQETEPYSEPQDDLEG